MTNATKLPKATHEGEITIGTMQVPCAVLENGQRVITQSGFMKVLGRARQAKGRSHYDSDVNMPAFLTAKNLKPYISKDLEVTSSQIEFHRKGSGSRTAYGYPAELLPKVCDVFLDAEEAGALALQQKHIAARARIIIRSLAHVGITALVDEATGYQEIRDKKALQAILDRYLRKELAAWAKRFPDEFYKEMFRLRDWNWSYLKRPAYVGKLTNDVVYERITPGLLAELNKRSPKNEDGKRQGTLQQLFTDDVGHPALAQHLHAVIGLMRATGNWDGFYRLLQRAFPKKNDQLSLLIED